MIISCPSCSTRYIAQAMDIGANGRTVKCVKCNYCWFIPGNSEKPFVATNRNPRARASSTSPEHHLVSKTKNTINFGSAEDYRETIGPGNLGRHIDELGRENIKKATPNDGVLSSEIKNLTTQPKPTIRDKKSSCRVGVIGCLVLFLLVTGTISGAVKYRKWVTTTWPPTAELYRNLGLTTLVQKTKLRVRNVSYKYLSSDTLKVNGELVSVAQTSHDTPTLKVVFLDGNGIVVLNRKLSLPKKVVMANETLKFSTEIHNPPIKAKRIEVDVAK